MTFALAYSSSTIDSLAYSVEFSFECPAACRSVTRCEYEYQYQRLPMNTAFDSSPVSKVYHGGCASLTLRMLSSFVRSIPATISSFFSSSRCTGAPDAEADAEAGVGPSAPGVAAAGDAEGGAMGTDAEEGEGTGTGAGAGTTGCGAADTSDMMPTI